MSGTEQQRAKEDAAAIMRAKQAAGKSYLSILDLHMVQMDPRVAKVE